MLVRAKSKRLYAARSICFPISPDRSDSSGTLPDDMTFSIIPDISALPLLTGVVGMHNPWMWVGFTAFVLSMLFIDLFVFHSEAHKVNVREALIWSIVWITLALIFCVGLYFHADFGKARALEFLSGYLIEKALSVDNLFVFLVIFSYFKVPNELQHRVLFWGIVGALILMMRRKEYGCGYITTQDGR